MGARTLGVCGTCQSSHRIVWSVKHHMYLMDVHHSAAVMGEDCALPCLHYKCDGEGTAPDAIFSLGK